VVVETWSQDQGRSWSELRATSLPNPNSGLDGVTLQDGRHLLVYNHKVRDRGRWEGSRSRLNVAVSVDGKEWQAAAELENQPGEYSYPAVIQARDGTVHVSYTWRRKRIQHVEIDPEQLVLRAMVDGVWPEKPVTR
jgi:predicted neuraminidase